MSHKIFKVIAVFVIVFSNINRTQSWWSRRRRSCHPTDCRVSSWSSWSPCSAQQCGISGSQHRSRSLITSASCGGSCPAMQESRACRGATVVDCKYSVWSAWNACSQCGDNQTRTRYVMTREQCGGTPCNLTALLKTRACQTRCLDKGRLVDVQCFCRRRPGYHGSCCIYHGFTDPCPYGKVGEPPLCQDPPKEFSSGNLGDPVITYSQPDEDAKVKLICEVPLLNRIGYSGDVTYEIEWFADGKSIKKEKRCSKDCSTCRSESDCKLNKTDSPSCPGADYIKRGLTQYKVGQWISCSVSAKYNTNCNNTWSTPKEVREPFYAGIQIRPSALTLATCDTSHHTITITPTIPIACTTKRRPNSCPRISFHTPPEVYPVGENPCEVQLQEGLTPVKITIKAACKVEDVTQGLKAIIPYISYSTSEMWGAKTVLPTIWVNIRVKSKIEQCSSTGDPHYRTLQPNTFGPNYDYMGRGDFILYKNTERHFEVHTRQWLCPDSSATCNCGVVLRDHNDVIEFNCCNDVMERDRTTPIAVKIKNKKCLSPGISIKKTIPGVTNAEYEVMFPSGAKVTIQRATWGVDVYLYTPRATYTANETGLCLRPGGVDHKTYGDALRLLTGESFFDTLPPRVDDYEVKYDQACECIVKTKGSQSQKAECENAFNKAFPTVQKKKLSPMFLCDRQKRDVQISDDLTEEEMQLFRKTRPLHHRFRREVPLNHISKENATRYCAEKISETKIGKLCATIGVNVQSLVSLCSADLELTGDVSFASGSVTALMDQCGMVAARNLSLQANESSGDSGAAASALVEEITESLCPNDCSFNGKCVNGSCVCNKDYTASDCSASIYQIPKILSLQGDGLCDKRKRPCKKVTVLGSGFINSNNMTCHVKEFKVVNSTWTPDATEKRFPGTMTDLVLADCHLPESPVMPGSFDDTKEGTPAAGLVISVSNDGEHRSRENLTFISYDSACMTCNVSSGCALKENSCFISRYCFAPNETNPSNWCYQCVPDVNTSAWTKRQVNHPPQFSSTKEFYALFQEHLELSIDVSDPEGMPVTVSLMDGSPSNAVMRDNVLVWNVTKDAKTYFFLKATDACQAVSVTNITVSLNVCPCKNSGRCLPDPDKPRGSGYYRCACEPGFTGDKCETNIDECQSYPCIQGRCIDGVNNFTCSCDPGYVGRKCDTDYDDCSPAPCVHGTCTDYTGSYRCTCDPGFSGENCIINIDECQSSPCIYGSCTDRVNNYTCRCQQGYTGHDCEIEIDECQSSPCLHGTCQDKLNDFTCNCALGFTGKRCDVDIDECYSNPCKNGSCIDLVNNYTCRCNVGFAGRNCDEIVTNCTEDSCYLNVTCFKNGHTISCGPCPLGFSGDGKNCEDIDDCVNHTCQNGGSCVDGLNNYSCNCVAGFTGDHCDTDIDDCVNHTCHNGGSCGDGVNNYSCNCVAGFTGDHCDTDIDDCVNRTCLNGGSCVDGVNNYSCNCAAGFTGDHCETDIDDCVNHSCHNGGSCVDGINNYSCNCVTGFTGDQCDTDIDDCVNHTCHNGGSCVDGINNYSCNCVPGFTGDHCDTDIDDCVNRTCHNGGSCVDGLNNYSCNCGTGFTGDHCDTDIDDCVNHTCHNGGSCMDGLHNYSCNCVSGFTGDHCDTDIDDCVNRHSCQNGGSCVDGLNNYSCNCVAGFTGNHCETVISSSKTTTTRTPAMEKTSVIGFSYNTIQVSSTSNLLSTATSTQPKESVLPTTTRSVTASKTPPTPTEESETEYVFKMKVLQDWKDDLKDKNSAAFKELSSRLEAEIWKELTGTKDLTGVRVLSFRKGSIVAEFRLTYRAKISAEDVFADLKDKMAQGNLGSLRVDPASLEQIYPNTQDPTPKTEEPKINWPIIIGASSGGMFVLALTTIFLIRSYKKKRHAQRRSRIGSQFMPAEEEFGNHEKYELKDAKSDENIVFCEEVGIRGKTMEGKSNEAFD